MKNNYIMKLQRIVLSFLTSIILFILGYILLEKFFDHPSDSDFREALIKIIGENFLDTDASGIESAASTTTTSPVSPTTSLKSMVETAPIVTFTLAASLGLKPLAMARRA